MNHHLRQSDLEAYLDEALPTEDMARIEKALRNDPDLVQQLARISARRDAGVHSLGEIWRRRRLSCVSREQLGSYLLGVLPEEQAQYVQFHLETIGCRYCRANREDLDKQQMEARELVETRRRKYYQSSAGYLRRD
jgi:anti-sigma factor RsiW